MLETLVYLGLALVAGGMNNSSDTKDTPRVFLTYLAKDGCGNPYACAFKQNTAENHCIKENIRVIIPDFRDVTAKLSSVALVSWNDYQKSTLQDIYAINGDPAYVVFDNAVRM